MHALAEMEWDYDFQVPPTYGHTPIPSSLLCLSEYALATLGTAFDLALVAICAMDCVGQPRLQLPTWPPVGDDGTEQ